MESEVEKGGLRGEESMMTDEELRQIAVDLHAGRIWSDRNCRSVEEVRMSFLIVAFMDGKDLKAMEERGVDFIYEYLDQAGPRSVNGMPVFLSMKTLTKPEADKMFEFYKKIKAAVDSVKA